MRKVTSAYARTIVPVINPDFGIMSGKSRRIIDCYEVLESVAWIWRLFGVFPIKIHGPIGMKRYFMNKFVAAYSLAFYAIIVGNFAYVMVYFEYYFPKSSIHIRSITILVRAVGNQLCMMASMFYRFIQHKQLAGSINSMPEQDCILERMNCATNYESSKKIIQIYVYVSIVVVLLLMAYDLIGSLQAHHNILSAEYVLWNVGLLIQIIDLTIFVSLIFLLGLNFQALNKKIRTIVIRANASSPKVIVTSDVCADNLRIVSKAHFNMCAIGKQINKIFEWDIVINVATAFIIMSTTLYYIFYEVQREGETDVLRIMAYIHWEVFHSTPIIIIVLICNWTSQQGIYAGKLIHEIRVEKKDSRLYEAVKSFSLQLHHQKLEFTASGLFALDSTLIQTMIGKITTYLVILIQFQPKLD